MVGTGMKSEIILAILVGLAANGVKPAHLSGRTDVHQPPVPVRGALLMRCARPAVARGARQVLRCDRIAPDVILAEVRPCVRRTWADETQHPAEICAEADKTHAWTATGPSR